MARPEKEAAVAALKQKFQDCAGTAFVHYQGLNVATIGQLREKCRADGVEFVVRKNTLAAIAARELDLEDATQFFVGPTAFAFHLDDPTAPARVIKDFAKEAPTLALKGGLLEGAVLDKAGVERLAAVPPREVLLSMLVGTLQAPISGLARALNALPSGLARALAAVRDQKDDSAG